jgi:glyoxylase-like metal-dependent hydrolase (beta-lactamase superfamily II)
MLFRQVGVSTMQALGAIATWNRRVEFLEGSLRIVFMNNLPALALTTVFGERFTAIRYKDVLIDPGPLFGRSQLERWLKHDGIGIHAIVATHSHEEHVGNAGIAAEILGVPVYGTDTTLMALREPERLSFARRTFIGQPEGASSAELAHLGDTIETPAARLAVVESPGHCDGHASLFDVERGVLFAGDSFLHTVFTAPNQEVSGDDWIATLRRYGQLDVKTMVGTHGYIYTEDSTVPRILFVTKHTNPREMILEKLAFLEWARDLVAEGERRSLSYGVIEACLFPWQRWWSWHNWFTDEAGRLFSAGEFSRTYFVRSLSRTPEKVPPRFRLLSRLTSRSRSIRTRAASSSDAGSHR